MTYRSGFTPGSAFNEPRPEFVHEGDLSLSMSTNEEGMYIDALAVTARCGKAYAMSWPDARRFAERIFQALGVVWCIQTQPPAAEPEAVDSAPCPVCAEFDSQILDAAREAGKKTLDDEKMNTVGGRSYFFGVLEKRDPAAELRVLSRAYAVHRQSHQ